MQTEEQLRQKLNKIDNKGYGAYKSIKGGYKLGDYELYLDYIQGDPFAAPSKGRIRVAMDKAGFPDDLYNTDTRRLALEDYLARRARNAIRDAVRGNRGSGKSGSVSIDAGRQEVLERTACVVTNDYVELRFEAGMPAKGRKVLGRQAEYMLTEELPEIAGQALIWKELPKEELDEFVDSIENQAYIRSELENKGLIAFIANGSILPRQSGASDQPLSPDKAIPFESPESMKVSFTLPNPHTIDDEDNEYYEIEGMGIAKGITLIVGGGYHGKSTLLNAIELGIYPHIPHDGREYVVTNPNLVKVRAEDGRRVENVDIHSFISDLPDGSDTSSFCSDDASGSTSQAANIMEAFELGASGLLIDEDTSATNFMIRDARMQTLVHKDNEPITPFLDQVESIYQDAGISTIMVMGGSGDYFDVANKVVMMKNYLPYDVTDEARQIADSYSSVREKEEPEPFRLPSPRYPDAESLNKARGKKGIKIKAQGLYNVQFGKGNDIELRFLEQLVDTSQTNAIGDALKLAINQWLQDGLSMHDIGEAYEQYLDTYGMDGIRGKSDGEHPGNYARPRKFEFLAALNRLRIAVIEKGEYEKV